MAATATVAPWHVGDEIRKARRDAGLEQDELAEKVGVSRPTLSRWENGHSEPTVSQFRAIARETKARWLLDQNAKFLTYGRRHDDPPVELVATEGQMELAFTPPAALESVDCSQ